ncbi:MAG: glutathione-dependent formaldehyde dehydrogenase, partial [Bacilli bacterium]|nr:glutathione-dependent formaldehyde dehydrogenase [Bacilli bacterium]
HEPMGIVEEVGPEVTKLKKGDRVIIPFNVACGECFFCQSQLTSQCDRSNPNEDSGGYFGYSHTFGGYAGGQAEFMRVPFANFTSFRVPENSELEDEQIVLIGDAACTAYWSVQNAGVKSGDTVIVLGCGPVGLLTQKFCWLNGAKRVIAVDYIDYRLDHAKRHNKVETFNFETQKDIGVHLREITQGGADVVIDCVGMDGKMTPAELLATALKMQGGTISAIMIGSEAVRRGGTLHITGAYGLTYNTFPLGHLFNRNINLRMGQAPVIPYMQTVYQLVDEGKVDIGDVVTHTLPLDEAEKGYEVFDRRTDGAIKVVLKP